MIDLSLTTRLSEQWRRLGVPWIDDLRPGLADARIDELIGPIDLRLPLEARQLWRWFDIGDVDPRLTPNYTLMPLRIAVREVLEWREIAEDTAATQPSDDPSNYWPSSFFPVFDGVGADSVAVDCSRDDGNESPLFYVDVTHAFDKHIPHAPSIAAFLTRVCELYEAGAYAWRSDPVGHWDYQGAGEDPLTPPNLL